MKLNQILPLNFKGKLFIQLFAGFIIASFVGIIALFSGAFIAAKSVGEEIRVYYNGYSTGPGCIALHANWDFIDSIKKKYPDEIKSNADFPDKQRYTQELAIRKTRITQSNFVAIGTILFPIIIGTIGLILLLVNKRKYNEASSLSFMQWIMVFLSLFWLRCVIDIWIKLSKLVFPHFNYYSFDSRISRWLNMGNEGFPIIECIVGSSVLIFVIFRFIPKQERLTFLLSGLFGGVTGFYLWLFVVGKYILAN